MQQRGHDRDGTSLTFGYAHLLNDILHNTRGCTGLGVLNVCNPPRLAGSGRLEDLYIVQIAIGCKLGGQFLQQRGRFG